MSKVHQSNHEPLHSESPITFVRKSPFPLYFQAIGCPWRHFWALTHQCDCKQMGCWSQGLQHQMSGLLVLDVLSWAGLDFQWHLSWIWLRIISVMNVITELLPYNSQRFYSDIILCCCPVWDVGHNDRLWNDWYPESLNCLYDILQMYLI